MTEDKTNVTVFCRPQFAGQPETPEMKEKFQRAMLEYTQTGKLSPDMPDLLVQEEDGNFHSVKETARERISALSQLIAEVSETMPDGVPAAENPSRKVFVL